MSSKETGDTTETTSSDPNPHPGGSEPQESRSSSTSSGSKWKQEQGQDEYITQLSYHMVGGDPHFPTDQDCLPTTFQGHIRL